MRHHHRPVPHLLGIEGTSGNSSTKLWFVVRPLEDAALAPVLTGLLSLIAMMLLPPGRRIPAALLVAVVATILVALLGGSAATCSSRASAVSTRG